MTTRKSSGLYIKCGVVLSHYICVFALKMMKLSVLIAIWLQVAQCRRLTDDMDNEISSAPVPFHEDIWVKISTVPKEIISETVGAYVEIECEAMGSPPPSIQWLKGKTPLTQNVNYESNLIDETPSQSLAKVRSRLIINHLLPLHEDRYTCVAESNTKIATAQTRVYVIKKENYAPMNFTQLLSAKILGAHHLPRITLWTPTYMDVIGANVVLPCQTVGNPKPRRMWLSPQGRIIGEGDGRMTVLPEGQLSIRNIGWGDMGVYSCIVRNSVGQDSAETFLYPMKDSK